MSQPKIFSAEQLRIGLQARFEREITAETVESFAGLSADWNPLHTDAAYAATTNYGGCIVHGAFQVALASAMAGMYLPGLEVVVGSFQCRFPAPLRYPCRVGVQGEITAWLPESTSGTLRVRITDVNRGVLTAEIHVVFSLHEKRDEVSKKSVAGLVTSQSGEDNRPTVLITGANGGLGVAIVSALDQTYRFFGLSRSLPAVPFPHGLEWIAADLVSADWEQQVERFLGGRKLFGIVHAAWPGSPSGGLLDADTDSIRAQTEFGTVVTIRAARFLRAQAAGPARLVLLGSTAATLHPALNMAAYSLGKAALEHTVRLLAPELARAAITINLVTPSFVLAGMNQSKPSRAVLLETARVPLGKLCSPEDVAAAVAFFLSPGAAFVTGQSLPLTGGQL